MARRIASVLLLATLLFASSPAADAARGKRARRPLRRGLAPVGAPVGAPLAGPRRVVLQAPEGQAPEEPEEQTAEKPASDSEGPAKAGDAPAGDAPAKKPAKPASGEGKPAKPAPAEPAPSASGEDKPAKPAPAEPAPGKEAPAEPAPGEPAPAAGEAEAPAAAPSGDKGEKGASEEVATWSQCGGTVPSQKGGSDALWAGGTRCKAVNDTCVWLSQASSTCIPITQSRGYGCSAAYNQCGGTDAGVSTAWSGPYCCAPSTQCIYLSPQHSECKPCQGGWSQARAPASTLRARR